jgi:hypothetical protein
VMPSGRFMGCPHSGCNAKAQPHCSATKKPKRQQCSCITSA